VKAEINRLKDEGLLPEGVEYIAWDAGSGPLNPDERVIPDDEETPLNKDYYANLKAQGWWQLRRRFEKTHNYITKGIKYPPEELISISSKIPKLRSLQQELSQPTAGKSTRMRLIVNKAPNGTRSPNMGDAVMQCYWPITSSSSSYDDSMSWL